MMALPRTHAFSADNRAKYLLIKQTKCGPLIGLYIALRFLGGRADDFFSKVDFNGTG